MELPVRIPCPWCDRNCDVGAMWAAKRQIVYVSVRCECGMRMDVAGHGDEPGNMALRYLRESWKRERAKKSGEQLSLFEGKNVEKKNQKGEAEGEKDGAQVDGAANPDGEVGAAAPTQSDIGREKARWSE